MYQTYQSQAQMNYTYRRVKTVSLLTTELQCREQLAQFPTEKVTFRQISRKHTAFFCLFPSADGACVGPHNGLFIGRSLHRLTDSHTRMDCRVEMCVSKDALHSGAL